MKTNVPGVYAAGDVTGKLLLAHAASRMGEVALNTIRVAATDSACSAVPWVVYTLPEIAGSA